MHAAPARYVSVSELYSTDEVELLLDEIRELEPTSCRAEDVQDFEIAGSGCGGGAGGRSPAGTEATERSWDSHAHYLREPPLPPQPIAPLYCHLRYLASLEGLCTLALVACCGAACGCAWAAGGRGGAARPLLLGAVSSALLHAALLLLRVGRLQRLLPLDWGALRAAAAGWAAASLAAGASRLLHALLAAPRPPAPHVFRVYIAAVTLGYLGAGAACGAGGRAAWRRWRRAPRGHYRAVPPPPAAPPPAPPPAPPQPGSSRHAPL